MSGWARHMASLLVLCGAAVLATAAEPQHGRVSVQDAWARATAPGMKMGAVYLTLQGGRHDDRLLSASTPRAGETQLHVVTVDNGMTRMRATDEVAVPAGKRVALEPQASHLMLLDLAQPLAAGERFSLELRFAQAGALTVSVRVVAPGDEPGPQP